ncbi:DNA mismatch repair protein MutL, partial [Oceanobacillus caeni]
LAPTNSSSPKEDIITSYEVNKDEIKDECKNEELSFKNVSKQRVPMMYPIGQLQGTYILAQNENGLYMIDQHAAQERIKYEFFRDKLGKPANELQELLLPMTFEFSKQESLFIEQYK